MFGKFKNRVFASVLFASYFLGADIKRSVLIDENGNSNKTTAPELPTYSTLDLAPNAFLPLYAPPQCVDQMSMTERKEIFLKLLAQQLTQSETTTDGQIFFSQTTSPGSLFHIISDFAPGAGWLEDPHHMFDKLKNDPRTRDVLPIAEFPCQFTSSQIMLIAEVLAEIPVTNTNLVSFRTFDFQPEKTTQNIAKIKALYEGQSGVDTLIKHLDLDAARLRANAQREAALLSAAKNALKYF